MVVPPGNHPAVPRDSDLTRTFQYVARCETEDARKDGYIRGRSGWFVHIAGYGLVPEVA